MSINNIKKTLENHLNENITTIAIKWNNTNSYSLNGVALTQSEVDALTLFIEPKIVPISQDTELLSTSDGRRFDVFFQVDVYNKLNMGTGSIYSTIELLDSIFVNRIINGTTVHDSKTLGSFTSGENTITPIRFFSYIYG